MQTINVGDSLKPNYHERVNRVAGDELNLSGNKNYSSGKDEDNLDCLSIDGNCIVISANVMDFYKEIAEWIAGKEEAKKWMKEDIEFYFLSALSSMVESYEDTDPVFFLKLIEKYNLKGIMDECTIKSLENYTRGLK